MRKMKYDIKDVIQRITALKGENIKMQVIKGRKKIEKYTGVIESIYPSIFTVKTNDMTNNRISYSYTEVLCGDVKIAENK